jgi:hypothetical protein
VAHAALVVYPTHGNIPVRSVEYTQYMKRNAKRFLSCGQFGGVYLNNT